MENVWRLLKRFPKTKAELIKVVQGGRARLELRDIQNTI
jgi:hypothetical protein